MKIKANAAIIVLAAIMVLGALSPSIAAEKGGNGGGNGGANGGQNGGEKSPKYEVCHFSGKAWKIVYVSGNALNNHIGNHNDGTDFDFKIDHEDEDPLNDRSVCLARN